MGLEVQNLDQFYKESENYKFKILAEGDSWFAYPRFILMTSDANIIHFLEEKEDLLIYNTARNGDELADMLSGKQKLELLKSVKHYNFDLLLLSGGGNDMFGNFYFGFLLKEFREGMQWQDCVDEKRLDIKLSQISLAYEEIYHQVQDFRPGLPVLTHSYDFPQPTGVGIKVFDIFPLGQDWLLRFFNAKGIMDAEFQRKIIRRILQEYENRFTRLTEIYPHFHLVKTQGLLKTNQWQNEIHPNRDGFETIANKIYQDGILPLMTK